MKKLKKILSLLIGATVSIIVVAAVLVPIIDDAESKTVSVGQNVNARYSASIGTELSGDLVYTYVDGKPALNGGPLHIDFYALQNVICVSDDFFLTQNSSLSTYLLRCEEGLFDVSEFRINADLTYEYTKTTGDTVTVDSAVGHLIYADNAGTLGAFPEGNKKFWLDHDERVYLALSHRLLADEQPDVTFHGLWSADSTTIGGSWTPIFTKIVSGGVYVDHPIDLKAQGLTVDEGALANEYRFNGYNATATINDIEYSQTRYDPIVFAPVEYHYRTASDNSIVGLLGAIPVLVIVGIVGYVARTALMDRRE